MIFLNVDIAQKVKAHREGRSLRKVTLHILLRHGVRLYLRVKAECEKLSKGSFNFANYEYKL